MLSVRVHPLTAVVTLAIGCCAAVTSAAPTAAGEIFVTEGFLSNPRSAPSLAAISADGEKVRLVLPDAGEGVVSASGRQLAFVRGRAIWVAGSDGSRARRVTSPPGGSSDDAPAWSQSGVIYFSRHRSAAGGETAAIYAVGESGNGLRRVTEPPQSSGLTGEPACDESPSVSPSGGLVLFLRIRSCSHGVDSTIVAVTARGQRATLGFRLAWPASFFNTPEYVAPAWSPDGQAIVYGVWDYGSHVNAVYVSRGGAPPKLVARWLNPGDWPVGGVAAWSPDGKELAFVRGSGCIRVGSDCIPRGDIWVARADGTGARRLTRTSIYGSPSWAAN